MTVALDWSAIRDRVDLVAVATSLLGPAPGRRGEASRRPWWRCPFHDDKNPSLTIDSRKGRWRCFGCGEYGDAAKLVMKLNGVGFVDAIRTVSELCNMVGSTARSTGPPA